MATGPFEEGNKTKGERSSKRQLFLQKHVFSVIMYCTIQYRMFPYTYKTINPFSVHVKVKTGPS